MKRPNLFNFATGELSQDAFICWLLSWADHGTAMANAALHQAGLSFLRTIYEKVGRKLPAEPVVIDIKRQYHHIDILCIVNHETALVIEDKIGSQQHSDQLARYLIDIRKEAAFKEVYPIYLQTGDQSDYGDVAKHDYVILKRHDLLSVLESADMDSGQHSDVFKDFTERLRGIENAVQSYGTHPPIKWTWDSWKGFYSCLQQELHDGKWDYVPNPSGGFLGFWWHFNGDDNIEQYLQLEQEKFCFKIWVKDAVKRTELRDLWHSKLISESAVRGIPLRRPRRLGNGAYMTVAVYDGEYRLLNDNGLIDIDATCALLRKAGVFLDVCSA